MPTAHIPFTGLHYFSSLLQDYVAQTSTTAPLYHRFPSLEQFESQIKEKQESFSESQRKVLANALLRQHAEGNSSENTIENIQRLQEETTFTITTGHQLNLFTGPVYFIYKIASTIQLTIALKEKYPEYNFVPIYWMATEDHDFEEINHFRHKGKKITWTRADGGAVGRFDTKGLEEVARVVETHFGPGKHATNLVTLFKKAYLEHDTLTAATRYVVNALFGDYGIVALDGDDPELKALFSPIMKQELLEQLAFQKITEQAAYLKDSGYKVQVNPRPINLFYLAPGIRARILQEGTRYVVHETSISWTREALLEELQTNPERFSPNVVLRPVYQEMILPNLCYIGGGGELAYWLELKSYFETIAIPFPMLLLRNSVLVMTEKQEQKRKKLALTYEELFLPQETLRSEKVKQRSQIPIDFTDQRNHLIKQFESLHTLAAETDKSFMNAVKAQEAKQIKGLDVLEKRLLKAQKRKFSEYLTQLTSLQDALFPNQSLQERYVNFSDFYLEYGDDFIPKLLEQLPPLSGSFTVLTF